MPPIANETRVMFKGNISEKELLRGCLAPSRPFHAGLAFAVLQNLEFSISVIDGGFPDLDDFQDYGTNTYIGLSSLLKLEGRSLRHTLN